LTPAAPAAPAARPVAGTPEREADRQAERAIVARWLEAHAADVRIVALTGGAAGPATPVQRLPELRMWAIPSPLPEHGRAPEA
ncbi:MAG: hypothetical protein M0007_10115, partial [Actinomycetota bacterium]|nr:hypothetical protein [Actinomycetota bacterium]